MHTPNPHLSNTIAAHRIFGLLSAQEQLRLAAIPYNAAIAQFPAQVLASLFGFKTAQIL